MKISIFLPLVLLITFLANLEYSVGVTAALILILEGISSSLLLLILERKKD